MNPIGTIPAAAMSTLPPSHQQSQFLPPVGQPFDERQPQTIRLYPLSNYTFGVKETQPEEDPSVKDRLRRLEEHYGLYGMRRTCEGVLVCHEHNHPHVLMLQIANAFFKLYVCCIHSFHSSYPNYAEILWILILIKYTDLATTSPTHQKKSPGLKKSSLPSSPHPRTPPLPTATTLSRLIGTSPPPSHSGGDPTLRPSCIPTCHLIPPDPRS